jgi:hypothetical protein
MRVGVPLCYLSCLYAYGAIGASDIVRLQNHTLLRPPHIQHMGVFQAKLELRQREYAPKPLAPREPETDNSSTASDTKLYRQFDLQMHELDCAYSSDLDGFEADSEGEGADSDSLDDDEYDIVDAMEAEDHDWNNVVSIQGEDWEAVVPPSKEHRSRSFMDIVMGLSSST